MRVLEKGEEKVFVKRCNSCDSLIEFERSDVIYDALYARYEHDCPVCKQVILLSSKDLVPKYSNSPKITEECLHDTK
jgi:hypothetical protein